jgi:hypothetical protein
LAFQEHTDQARPPGGVLPAQRYGRLDNRLRLLRRHGAAPVIGGDHTGFSLLAEAMDQPPDGARGEAEDLGDGGTILAILIAPPDGVTNGHGKRARHVSSSMRGLELASFLEVYACPNRGQTSCRH